MQKSKRTKTSYRRRTLIALAVFIGIPTIILCMSITYLVVGLSRLGTPQTFVLENHGCLGEEPYQISKVESRAEFTLPPSAQNLFADSMAFQDCVVFVSFGMNPNDLNILLESTHIANIKPSLGYELTEVKGYLQNNITDWRFEGDKQYLYGKGQHPEGLEIQWIIVDELSTTLHIVYIVTVLL